MDTIKHFYVFDTDYKRLDSYTTKDFASSLTAQFFSDDPRMRILEG